jgi:multidrug efflux pump subunit AcrA (membrane-fusion protein)
MKKLFYLLVFLMTAACTPKEQGIKPRLTNITESVYASVFVRPESTYFPQSSRSGAIEKILVEEGDLVKKGQILFQVAASDIGNRLVDAQLDLALAKANYSGHNSLLDNLKLELQNQGQQYRLDSINFKRQERLWDQNIGAKIDLDQAKATYESSLNRYQSLKKNYQQNVQSLNNNYLKALNTVAAEELVLNDFTIRSAMDGKVYKVFKKVGELINTQEQFAEIGSADQFKLELDIDEVDITKIALGDTALISLEAYPNEAFKARLTKIYPKKEEITQVFKVECTFIELPDQFYNGLSGEANIIVAHRKNALIIPSAYLLSGNKVKTKEGDKAVRTGLKNMEFVEILSGVDTSMTLFKPQ